MVTVMDMVGLAVALAGALTFVGKTTVVVPDTVSFVVTDMARATITVTCACG